MQERKLPGRQCTDESKIEAVGLAGSIGWHEAARGLGMSEAMTGN